MHSDNNYFGEFNALRMKPILDLMPAREKRKNYREHPIDVENPLFSESMIPVEDVGVEGINFYHRQDNPPYYKSIPGSIEELRLRKSVAERLSRADSRLRAIGLKLHVFDAWRPIEVQRYFHDTWMPAYLQRRNPSLDGDALRIEVEKYWAAPTTNDTSPAPHSTGGAVDLTIHQVDGEPLHMGSIFDDVTSVAHTDFFEVRRDNLESFSDIEALENRRLLYWLMTEEGFSNNPHEWWHFSWGDQMWARLANAPAAVYGPTK